MSKNCCSSKDTEAANVNVNVTVDVPKIVKYCCVTGILIVGIIFGTRCFRTMLEEGFFELVEK
jgi:hypothetical protein